MALHLAAAGIVAAGDVLHHCPSAEQGADPFGSQQLEAGEARKVRPALHADFRDFERGVIVVREDLHGGVLRPDGGDHLRAVVAVVDFLARKLHQRPGDIRIFRQHAPDVVQLVEIGADQLRVHAFQRNLRGRVNGRPVDQQFFARPEQGGQSPPDRAGAGAADQHGVLGAEHLGEDLLHPAGVGRFVQSLDHAEVAGRKDLDPVEMPGHGIDDFKLQRPRLFEGKGRQRIGLHQKLLSAP